MTFLDDLDVKILKENFDDQMIYQLDDDNLVKIINYLENNGIYYAKDILLSYLDLFLLPANEFIKKFEKLKIALDDNYIDKLGENSSLIEFMYED